jgi:fused signal recognition particle receptor
MFDKLKNKLKGIKERIAEKISSKPVEEVSEEKVEPLEPVLPGVEPEVKIEEAPKVTAPVAPRVKVEKEVPKVEKPEAKPLKIQKIEPPKIEPRKAEIKPEIREVKPVKEKPLPRVEAPKAPAALPTEKPKKGIRRVVKKILGRTLGPEDIEDIIWELQVALLESDVAVPVVDNIIERMKSGLTGQKIGVKDDPKKLADGMLRQTIRDVLTSEKKVDILEVINSKRSKGEPAVIVFLGINGHGKTTTIAKMARYLNGRGCKVVMAAADTFRAAAIEQLEIHGQRLGMEVIKQRRGSDAAAVAYDAIAHAKAKGADVVLIDTAGRMQTDSNLMDEMKKIVRVAKPDMVIFVGDALTGNDAVEQAKTFDQAVGISGSILCKMDADARGGAALSITYATGKPILFIGTGQGYDDLVEFSPDIIINALFGD